MQVRLCHSHAQILLAGKQLLLLKAKAFTKIYKALHWALQTTALQPNPAVCCLCLQIALEHRHTRHLHGVYGCLVAELSGRS